VGTPELASHLQGRLDAVRSLLARDGRRLVLLSVPCADPGPAHEGRWAAVRRDPTRVEWVNSVWRRYAASHPDTVSVADLGAVLCPGGDVHAGFGDVELRPDGFNLSPAGASVIWSWLAPVALAEVSDDALAR